MRPTSKLTRVPVPKREVERITVRFWLKPHLHQFARNFCEPGTMELVDTNIIGCIALSCLTPKASQADRIGETFRDGRMPLTGGLCFRSKDAHGFNVQSYARFEFAVEHLFYHTMLIYVDAQQAEGVAQNEAIRRFLADHNVGLDTIQFDTLKKTIIRRRKRLTEHRKKTAHTLSPR
jgi:hypothetical protein